MYKPLKYVDTAVVLAEIPDEVTLAINISGCPHHCKGCHSSYLWDDVGEILNQDSLLKLVEKNPGISCVCFMGGDTREYQFPILIEAVKEKYPDMKFGWYSGYDVVPSFYNKYFDYIKVGPYQEDKGPLDNPRTNQKLYQITPTNDCLDITYKLWK